ncbi:unnamed protein product [Paramecium pentaurelia]|uniref:Uncharacterized protein n=1 Tax=Paramecium pentaurelia TaxID=43138 RepID=A0A8S1YN98_9CILI|nr:unnamed protein product [Paramecium pentaurelia]
MSQFTFMKKYLQKQTSETKMHCEPLITLTIELDENKYSQINIYEDSNPEILASNFVTDNYLSVAYVEPLKQNIIQQMLMYDQMKKQEKEKQPLTQWETVKKQQQNKENQQLTPTRNLNTKRCTPEKSLQSNLKSERNLSRNKRFQTEDMNIHERLYQQAKQTNNIKQQKKEQEQIQIQTQKQKDPNLTFKPKINNTSSTNKSKSPQSNQNQFYLQPTQQKQVQLKSPRLNQLYQNKSFEFLIPKKEVKISILENEESVTQLPKTQDSPNVSFSEESQFKNDSPYTSAQEENSLYQATKDSDERIVAKLFTMIESNNVVDARNIPYEKFNYQLIVELRLHFQKNDFKIMNCEQFCQSVLRNSKLIKFATDFFKYENVQYQNTCYYH